MNDCMLGRFFGRLLFDETGQDLIEYGLLASIIAISGVLVLPVISTKMGNALGNWGNQVYNLWIPDEPGS